MCEVKVEGGRTPTLETIENVHGDQHAPCAHYNHFYLRTRTQKEPRILFFSCCRARARCDCQRCTNIDAVPEIDRH